MEQDTTDLYQRLLVIAIALIVGSVITRLAAKRGFFSLPDDDPAGNGGVDWKIVFFAFSIFLLSQVVYAVLLAKVVSPIYTFFASNGILVDGSGTAVHGMPTKSMKDWGNLASIAVVCSLMILFYSLQKQPVRAAVWGKSINDSRPMDSMRNYAFGGLSWFIIYPWILIAGQVLAILTALFFTLPSHDQDAVKMLKDLQDKPYLLTATLLLIVTFVPILEELLFRGFVQSWLKNHFSTPKAIAVTSAIFAFSHFSTDQGISNIELLGSLFVLSCFIGFVKEKRQSLWASIGLHSIFNLLSSIFILTME